MVDLKFEALRDGVRLAAQPVAQQSVINFACICAVAFAGRDRDQRFVEVGRMLGERDQLGGGQTTLVEIERARRRGPRRKYLRA